MERDWGPDWHTFQTFLGIEVPLETLRPLRRRLVKVSKKSVFKVYIYEPESDCRTDTVERCTGFFGIVRKTFTCKEVASLTEKFVIFMKENIEILNEFGLEISEPVMRGGIAWSVSVFHADLRDMEDEKIDSDADRSVHDD
jgi:hypothetical protein